MGPKGGGEMAEMPRDLTLEINAAHPTIINLNTLRKADPEFAREISQVFLDQVLTASNIPFDIKESVDRNQKMMADYLDESLSLAHVGENSKVAEEASFEPIIDSNEESEASKVDDEHESILKQAHRDIRGANESTEKIILDEYKVTGKEKVNKK